MVMRENEKVFGELADEIELLLRAHALTQEDEKFGSQRAIMSEKHFEIHLRHKSAVLAQILNVCRRLRCEAKRCDGDVLRLLHTSVPKEKCSRKGCPEYGKHLVWDMESGVPVCAAADEENVLRAQIDGGDVNDG